jgi:hypothetical protein
MQKPRPPYTTDPSRCRAAIAHVGHNGRGCARTPSSAADRQPVIVHAPIHAAGDVWLPGPSRFALVCPVCHKPAMWLVTQRASGGTRPPLACPVCDTVPRSVNRTVRRAS